MLAMICTHVGVRTMRRTYAVSLLPTIRNMRLLTLRSFNTGLRGREHILEHGPPIARQPREQVAELAAGLHCPGENAGGHRLRLTGLSYEHETQRTAALSYGLFSGPSLI